MQNSQHTSEQDKEKIICVNLGKWHNYSQEASLSAQPIHLLQHGNGQVLWKYGLPLNRDSFHINTLELGGEDHKSLKRIISIPLSTNYMHI